MVLQARAGDRGALAELVSRYERRAYGVALRLLGHRADAADAAQEALMRVYRCLHRFRGEAAFSTWLFRVVTNVCLDELKRRKRRPQHLTADPYAQAGAPGPVGPEEVAERRRLQAVVQAALQGLPEDYRVALVLRDMRGYTYEEIATGLGCAVGTVKSRVHRGRRALAGLLPAYTARELAAAAG